MTPPRFPPILATALAISAVAVAPAVAQTGDEPAERPERRGFERRYIDADAYRSDRVLLRDWPALERLLAGSRALEAAVAGDDQTLSAELLAEFRARVDSLSESPLPDFLAARADTVRAAIEAIGASIDRAEASLDTIPPRARPTGGEGVNAPERQRTLVTGNTAVTVPAGVEVGGRDTLPTAEVGGEPRTFVDLVALALADLDRLVHLVRTAGEPLSPETEADGTEAAEGTAKPEG